MLKDENTRLRVLAEHDWLTGLYNRRAAEAHVDEALLKNGGGMLLVLDIDHFKQVNDRYGHLIGDALLCETARTLRDIFFPRDIIGRVGGDEFIIYILGGCSQEAVDGRAAQLAERLRKAGRRYGMQWNLSFTLGLAEKQAGDDYISLFDRADQMLLARKKARRARRADSADAGGERSICTDMALIRRELREKDPPKGAFCQDYETFKQIYRFVERGLKRSGQSAYIILMTLTDAQGAVCAAGRARGVYEPPQRRPAGQPAQRRPVRAVQRLPISADGAGRVQRERGRHRRAHPHAVYVARCARCGAAAAV